MKSVISLDWVIFVCAVLLSGFGAAVIGSVAAQVLFAQVAFYLVGLVLFFVFSRIDYRLYGVLAKPIYFAALLLLAVTLAIGLESRGAVRWISVGPLRLQFSEILKPFLVAAFAARMAKVDVRSLRQFLVNCLWVAVPVFLVLKQPDLGSAMVYFSAFAALIFAAGTNLSFLLASVFSSVAVIPVVWHFLAGYQRSRILSFLEPQTDPLGASYNAIQALISVGSGSLLGKGLGRGTQSHLYFLPEHHTDFIFASLAEEMGFVGAAAVVVTFFVLCWRLLVITTKCPDQAGRLTALGIGILIITQLFVNVGMNIGIVPVTGITLPLISYGGSSVISTMIGLGIVENIVLSSRPKEEIRIG